MSRSSSFPILWRFIQDKNGGSQNPSDSSQTPVKCTVHDKELYSACLYGDVELVKACLSVKGVNVNNELPGVFWERPLTVAINHKHVEVIKVLLARPEIDVNYRMKFVSVYRGHAYNEGKTLLYHVVNAISFNTFKLLMEHPDTDPTKDEYANHYYLSICINQLDKFDLIMRHPKVAGNESCLINAFSEFFDHYGAHAAVEHFLRNVRLDMNTKDHKGRTLGHRLLNASRLPKIMYASFNSPSYVENIDILERFKMLLAWAEVDVNATNKEGKTMIQVVNEPLKSIFTEYGNNPAAYRRKLRKEHGYSEEDAKALFKLVHFSNRMPKGMEFFLRVARRLPTELQMRLCNLAYEVNADFIPGFS